MVEYIDRYVFYILRLIKIAMCYLIGLCNIIGLPIYCNILVSDTYCNTFFHIAIRSVFPLFPLISNLF